MAKISEIAKSINKAWKSDVLTAGDLIPDCVRFSMGALSADYALYGGLPEGKLIVYAGESGSCKSLLACLAMAQYQKAHPDKVCIYVDVEDTLRGQIGWFVKMTGLDISGDRFLRYECVGKSAEEIFRDVMKLQEADDIGLIVIDSAPMLISQADIDNDITKDNGQRASIAKSMGKFLKFMVPALGKVGNSMIIINHTRVAGKTFTGAIIYTEPCGYALNFYPSTKVRFATRKFTLGDKIDISASQSADSDGICATFTVTKNRLGAMNRGGAKIIFRFDTGIDTVTDLIEIITKYEIAKLEGKTWRLVDPNTGNTYYDKETGEELKFVGKPKLIEYIKTHDEFRKEYEKAVNNYINHTGMNVSLIDEAELQAIKDVEASLDATLTEEEDEKPVKISDTDSNDSNDSNDSENSNDSDESNSSNDSTDSNESDEPNSSDTSSNSDNSDNLDDF